MRRSPTNILIDHGRELADLIAGRAPCPILKPLRPLWRLILLLLLGDSLLGWLLLEGGGASRRLEWLRRCLAVDSAALGGSIEDCGGQLREWKDQLLLLLLRASIFI